MPHQEINASAEETLECVLMRSGNEAIVVNLDIEPVEAPENVNSIAQAAAVAALGDEDFVRRTYENNRAGMQHLVEGVKALGLEYIPSYGNFVTVDVGDGPRVFNALLKRGVIVRPIVGYELPRHVRVTIGLPHENARFLASLKEALAEVRG